jgi:hypothetical protein
MKGRTSMAIKWRTAENQNQHLEVSTAIHTTRTTHVDLLKLVRSSFFFINFVGTRRYHFLSLYLNKCSNRTGNFESMAERSQMIPNIMGGFISIIVRPIRISVIINLKIGFQFVPIIVCPIRISVIIDLRTSFKEALLLAATKILQVVNEVGTELRFVFK